MRMMFEITVSDNCAVTSQLSGIPTDKRRQLAATLGLFAMLFFAVGAVALTVATTVGMKVFVGLAFVVAAVLGLIAWGVITSIKNDLAEQRLDDAIADAMAARNGQPCGCGHDHDVTEMHVQESCAHDGNGDACAHDCDTCVLAALRPARPAAASRPSPRPRPRPTPTPR
jgi:hypothetical protein